MLQGMIERQTELGRCCGMEINVEKTRTMRISIQPSPTQTRRRRRRKKAGEFGIFQHFG